MFNEYTKNLITSINNTVYTVKGSQREYILFDEGIDICVDMFYKHKKMESRLFFIGNGGSAAIASHMTADFLKNGAMNICSLCDSAVITCMGNDYGYEFVFSQQLATLAKESDLLIAISSSGKSQNIVNAVEVAKNKNLEVITLTGFDSNNPIRQMGDINIYVPCSKYGIVESIHNHILQEIVDLVAERDNMGI